jgi:hypothetical protein
VDHLAHVLVVTGFLMRAGVGQPVKIEVARGTVRELATKAQLEHVLDSYDLARYTFTRHVVIELGARNHAFPVLTLNVRFADSPDDLLASFVHEQIHWHIRAHDSDQRRAVTQLRRMYPKAPVGLPEGADTEFSTYGHLVTCYLEIQVIRRFLGVERAAAVVDRKGHYTWIYRTVLSDEPRIAAIVAEHRLQLE